MRYIHQAGGFSGRTKPSFGHSWQSINKLPPYGNRAGYMPLLPRLCNHPFALLPLLPPAPRYTDLSLHARREFSGLVPLIGGRWLDGSVDDC